MISQKEVPISKGCASLEISRRAYYYSLKEKYICPNDKTIRSSIIKIAKGWPKYGYRRITAELHRRGHPINHEKMPFGQAYSLI